MYELKSRTIRVWLKQQAQQNQNTRASESEEEFAQFSKKKQKSDREFQQFQNMFNMQQDNSLYNFEIKDMDALQNNGSQQEQKQQPPQKPVPAPQQQQITLSAETINMLRPQPYQFAIQNFDALLLLLDEDDEIHYMVSLLRDQERQIEEIKKTQKSILEYLSSHLQKKSKKI